MSVAIFEFPLGEKVRNYLRLELLFQQLDDAENATTTNQEIHFLRVMFDIMDMIERLDLRADFIRDLDQQERNLVHWSQHPEVDSKALETALEKIRYLVKEIKQTSKFALKLKEDKFLANIRQRFSIVGGATAFDLPSLFCWIGQADNRRNKDRKQWLSQLEIVKETIFLLLSFLREKGRFETVLGKNGFYQGNVANDKADLVRVRYNVKEGDYPVLSGNTYRYGIKFMQLDPDEGTAGAIAHDIEFEIARC